MLSITFLGTSASIPTIDRNVAGLAVQREGETILFDCGEGSQRQMMRYGVGFSFREIFFTHYHADHMLGVTGLLRTLGLQDRSAPVMLYGPKGAQRVLGAAITLGIERNKFPVEILEVKPGDRLARDEYDVVVFETDHRADTVGLRWWSTPVSAASTQTGLASWAFPKVRSGGTCTGASPSHFPMAEPSAPATWLVPLVGGGSLVYTGDTRPHLAVIEAARGADLLVHEATFGGDEQDRAKETGHSTAAEAARVAVEAGARRLVLTHISSRYNRDAAELLAEAKAVFPETIIARDGMTLDVPYSDGD